jgi:hypothetical protein
VPGFTPVIKPELEPIVTNDGLLLLHVPPEMPALKVNVVECVPHTISVPEITGVAFTVTVVVPVAVQPELGADAVKVYVPLAAVVVAVKVGEALVEL